MAEGGVQCRTILWYLVFSGVVVYVVMLSNINVAIIEMVKVPKDNSTSRIEWTEFQQGMILGATNVAFIVSLPCGIIVNKYGAKLLFGWSNLLAAVFTLLVPMAAYCSFEAMLTLRVLHGFFGGSCFPFLHAITAKWVPPNERSNFITTYLGSAPAIAVVYPLFGWVISVSSWENVFYLSSFMGFVWCLMWYFLMFDSPAQHPRISKEERDYIESTLIQIVTNRRLPIPWRNLLLSGQVWLNTLANWSYSIAFWLSITYFPMYFKHVHDQDLKTSAATAGLPHFIRLFAAIFYGRLCDTLISREKVSRTNIRRVSTAACTLLSGLVFLIMAYTHNFYLDLVLVIVVVTTTGFPNAGFFAAMVDIAPNFASIILGLGTVAGSGCGFMVTLFVGYMTEGGQQTQEQWQKIFLTCAVGGIVPGLLYVFFAKADVLDWNNPVDNHAPDNADDSQLKRNEFTASEVL